MEGVAIEEVMVEGVMVAGVVVGSLVDGGGGIEGRAALSAVVDAVS
jgi:hypothetical protein